MVVLPPLVAHLQPQRRWDTNRGYNNALQRRWDTNGGSLITPGNAEPRRHNAGFGVMIPSLREYCDKKYHQLLPIIAEKVHQEKVQQERLKAVKARLNFEETSQHSESGTPSRRMDLKKRLGPRHARSMSESPEPRHGHSESPRKGNPERKTVFRRLEKGVFHRLGDKEKSRSAYSNDSRRQSYHSSRRDTESCYRSSPSRETEFVSEKRHNKKASSRRTKALSESEGSAWGIRSQSQRDKSRVLRKTCPNHGKAITFNQRIKAKQWKRSRKGGKKGRNLRKGKSLAILMVQSWQRVAKQKINQTFSPKLVISFSPLEEKEWAEGPMIIEAEIGGHFVHRMYVDGGSSSEIMYEHCFNRFRPVVRSQLILADTPLVGFSGEIIWPLGKISLFVKIGDEEHSTSAWINFMVVRSPSLYNRIIGRPGVRKIQAVSSTAHGMLKFPVEVLVKKYDGSWRMCVDFKDLNKAFPKYGYALTEIDWKVESLCGYAFKYFLDAYKGYHQIKMAKEDEEKIAFITSQGIFCYSKMPFGLKNAGDTAMEDEEAPLDPWILFTDGLSCIDGSVANLIITNPERMEFTYALRFRFDATNNEAEYEALIAGLRIAEQMGVKNLQANVDSRLMANKVYETYVAKDPGIIKYLEKVKNLASTFKEFSIKQVPRGRKKKDALSKIASTSFSHLSKQVLVEELKEKSIDEKEVLAVVGEEGRTWMTPIHEYLVEEILPEEKKKARVVRWKARSMHAGPKSVVGKALRSGYYWPTMHADARKLIRECSDCQSSNGETLYLLTYETKEVILVEIGMPTWRTAKVNMIKNDEALEINQDLLEEKREQAAIQEAKSKDMMKKNTIMPGFATQVSSQETSSTEATKQAMRRMEAN
nr:reverse transcriptase domain-containing protein [Tanacetum cinerariifolium]